MATAKKTAKKTAAPDSEEPKRLSKAGEWMKNHPHDLVTIVDMRAVMK